MKAAIGLTVGAWWARMRLARAERRMLAAFLAADRVETFIRGRWPS